MQNQQVFMKILWMILLCCFIAGCNSNSEKTEEVEQTEITDEMEISTTENDSEEEVLSPPRQEIATIGNTTIQVDYSAPSAREREIFGQLVPYGEIWVSGAHMATSIEFDESLMINGEHVSAGKYAFFTIPSEESWTIILNENWDQHHADDYEQELDVARFNIEPEPNLYTEQLKYSVITETEATGVIELAWEELKISIPVSESTE